MARNKNIDARYGGSADVGEKRSTGRATVIAPYLKKDTRGRGPESRLEEALGLAEAIHLDVVFSRILPLTAIRPATYIGGGALEEVTATITENEIDLAIFDCTLSPVQQRNLEKALNVKVIDRTGLILEIFGERARTREGQLQVELASYTYQRSRLVRAWTHLERQRGGGGFLGGPGERQIELDRRRIDDRIVKIKKELTEVRRTRQLHRKARERVPYPVVALVGYTNAGKSTLFNRLTGADVVAKDMLFATLDPTMRQIHLPSGTKVILSDTVGFITDLPTNLVEAFRATLEEVTTADLILHVRDIAHPESDHQKEAVEQVLADMGIVETEEDSDARVLEVWNKIDLLPEDRLIPPTALGVSALAGTSLDQLLQIIDSRIEPDKKQTYSFLIENQNEEALAFLYHYGEILDRNDDEQGQTTIRLRLWPKRAAEFREQFLAA